MFEVSFGDEVTRHHVALILVALFTRWYEVIDAVFAALGQGLEMITNTFLLGHFPVAVIALDVIRSEEILIPTGHARRSITTLTMFFSIDWVSVSNAATRTSKWCPTVQVSICSQILLAGRRGIFRRVVSRQSTRSCVIGKYLIRERNSHAHCLWHCLHFIKNFGHPYPPKRPSDGVPPGCLKQWAGGISFRGLDLWAAARMLLQA